jgi:hypothetical protein
MHAPQLAHLSRLADEAAAEQLDMIAFLADVVKAVAGSDADPYLALGAMIEGVVYTLGVGVPPERRGDTAKAAVGLLFDRLHAAGLA